MITVYGYDWENDIYDNIAEIHNEDVFAVSEEDILHDLVWCAKLLAHHALSSKRNEYGWLCISKDARDREEDMHMHVVFDPRDNKPIFTLSCYCKDYKETFVGANSLEHCSFDFINW